MVGQASIDERQVVATPRKQAVGIDEVAWEASSNEGSDLDLDVKSEGCAPSLSTMEDSATPQAYKRHLFVSHLQEENTRLQKALEELQFEVQRLQQDAKREKMSGLDLAHILSLARDLNLDFDGGADCVQTKSNDEAEVFAIHSPRDEGPKESHSEEGGEDDMRDMGRNMLKDKMGDMGRKMLKHLPLDSMGVMGKMGRNMLKHLPLGISGGDGGSPGGDGNAVSDIMEIESSPISAELHVRTLCKNEPKKLKPSAIECMTRSGPNVAEVILRNVQCAPEDPTEVVEIVVKNETNSNQMKLSVAGKRREPVTIEKIKKALVAELGGGDSSEFGFLLRGGHTNAYRLDNEVIRPSRTKRAVELVVRGIEIPKPTEPQSSMNLSPAMSFRTVSSATFVVEEETEFLKVPSLQGEAFSEWIMY